jgi:hypothetical protein
MPLCPDVFSEGLAVKRHTQPRLARAESSPSAAHNHARPDCDSHTGHGRRIVSVWIPVSVRAMPGLSDSRCRQCERYQYRQQGPHNNPPFTLTSQRRRRVEATKIREHLLTRQGSDAVDWPADSE